MARNPRRPPYLPGHFYHLYNRGRSHLSIFHEEDNYLFVLRKIKKYVAELRLTMIAYCLMPNHYHFLVRQDSDEPSGKLPQRIFNSYSKAYNYRYDHSGTLFEGPYKAKLVNGDRYLRHLCRYIHANPVKDGLVEFIEQWPYSNYQEWIGLRSGSLVDHEFIQVHFGTPAAYEVFVMDFLRDRHIEEEMDL